MADEQVSTQTQGINGANAVTEWSLKTQPVVIAGLPGRSNGAQAYTNALIQVAVYDAVVAIRGGYEPFYATINAPAGANLNAAIATAAYKVAKARLTFTTAQATAFDNTYNNYINAQPAGQSRIDGVAVGEAAAAATIAARASDHFGTATFVNPTPGPGVWQTGLQGTTGAADYAMSFVTPLTAATPGERRLGPPANIRSKKYARDWQEVKETGRATGSTRTPEMFASAKFWSESGYALWNRNTRELSVAKGLDELEAARFLAATAVAGGDAMLACFEAKYHYNFWRPIQAIRGAESDGNKRTPDDDETWTSLIATNHPEYPSGHSCYGGAMTSAIKAYFGGDIAVTLSSLGSAALNTPANGGPPTPVTYASLSDVVDDTGNARIWSGLHFRTSMEKSAKWTSNLAEDALCGNFGIECDDDDDHHGHDNDDDDDDDGDDNDNDGDHDDHDHGGGNGHHGH
jgi:hypothetical protein